MLAQSAGPDAKGVPHVSPGAERSAALGAATKSNRGAEGAIHCRVNQAFPLVPSVSDVTGLQSTIREMS